YPVTGLDTAGIRPSADPVEQEGVRRARERAQAADLVLWVTDRSDMSTNDRPPAEFNASEVWIIENKIDLSSHSRKNEYRFTRPNSFGISALTGAGVDQVVKDIALFAQTFFESGEPALVVRER